MHLISENDSVKIRVRSRNIIMLLATSSVFIKLKR